MKEISILLVDDHEIVRQGIKTLLETKEKFKVIGEACNGLEAIDKTIELHPDILIMDISMPVMDGLQATGKISKKFPEVHIIALTVHEDKYHFFEMIAAGAKGYISKHTGPDEIFAAIETVWAGHVYLQPSLAKFLTEDYNRLAQKVQSEKDSLGKSESERNKLDILSRREREVLEMIADEHTTPQIANKMELSPKTISSYRERIMKKLDLHSSTALVKFALRTGLIDL